MVKAKVNLIARMLKSIYAQENKESIRVKAQQVAESLREIKLKEVAKKLEGDLEETIIYEFPK